MSERDRPLKIGIIGAGMFAATSHLPALREKSGVEVTCGCRTREAKLKRFCETFGVPRGYTDHREMLEREELDGVVVASPHDLHYQHTVDALEAGVPVLLEKPMTLTLADADALQAKADETGLPVVVGYNRHWWPAYVKSREMIRRGDLGEPRLVIGEYHADLEWSIARDAEAAYGRAEAFYEEDDPPNFRGDPVRSGGGFFIDAGTHIAESICWMLDDDPISVHAVMENRGHGTDLDGVVTVRFKRGGLASVQFMGAARRSWTAVSLYGTGGTLELRHDSDLRYAAKGHPEAVDGLPPKGHPAHNFIDVLRGEAEVECTIADGRRAVALVSAAYESAETGATVTL